ncbi:MAG: ATP-binding cassette domain-containing protein, partial [Bifidobacteriaceae bacterium]|nr:ATP-binding cassette domain-containing protein [Bifidobacteriaceae bacterium]
MLEVRDLEVAYGRVKAVKGITLSVKQGQIVTLLGINGAGKSTTLRCISGLIAAVGGEVWFEGERIDKLPAHKIVQRGIAQSPEGRRLFKSMSVADNLMLGSFSRKDPAGIRRDLERVYSMFDVLAKRRDESAGLFSGGEQQMIAIGRAMMSNPKLL